MCIAIPSDITSRFIAAEEIVSTLNIPSIDIDEVLTPKEVMELVMNSEVTWESLSVTAKLAVLWQFGFVFVGTNGATPNYSQLVQIYTLCQSSSRHLRASPNASRDGVPMDHIVLSSVEFSDSQCLVEKCPSAPDVEYTTNNRCSPKLRKQIKCAVHSIVHKSGSQTTSPGVLSLSSVIPTLPTASFWMQAGNVSATSVPYPQLYAHRASVKIKSTKRRRAAQERNIYSIHMQPIPDLNLRAEQQCDSHFQDVVIPCLDPEGEITKQDFCQPHVDTVGLTKWLNEIVASDNLKKEEILSTEHVATSDQHISTFSIALLAILVLLIVGAIGSYYFLWYRPDKLQKRIPEKKPEKNPTSSTARKQDSEKNFESSALYYMTPNSLPMLGESSIDSTQDLILQQDVYDFKKLESCNSSILQDNRSDRSSYAFIASAPDSLCMEKGGVYDTYKNTTQYQNKKGPTNVVFTSCPPNQGTDNSRHSIMSNAGGKRLTEYIEESDAILQFTSDPVVLSRQIAYDEFTFLRMLSKGAFGEVWLGQLEDRHVAIKRLLPERSHICSNLEEFAAEIRLMCNLNHPNIVTMIGISWDIRFSNLCVLTEFMDHGDLDVVIEKYGDELKWEKKKLQIALDIAEGMLYLHSQQPVIIHRDMKSKNVLVNKKWQAKISDFGISRKTNMNETMTSGVGTLLWTAPEIIEGKKYSEKADIYSLGIVLGELDTGARPFAHMKNDRGDAMPAMQLVQQVRLGKARMQLRPDCPQSVRELIEKCTSLDPDVRPTSKEVAFTLRSKITYEISMLNVVNVPVK
uniref:Protein kinase putative n=1 Tax=Albugo laibachii Nc14 TaxID=890382 RepID=F0WP80_9STRA|nr:protein kinase putative [Albugo laibachii Nc14]|eukprot:CCA23126.1 protein kinase putative [Albugo laibachii Nc14]